jgi:hypothetical protein
VAAAAETAVVTLVNGASHAGKQPFCSGRPFTAGRAVQGPACEEENIMETFNKRQKEMRRLERQRDKAAKRKEIKARKAAGITNVSDRDTEAPENAAASDPAADPSTMD